MMAQGTSPRAPFEILDEDDGPDPTFANAVNELNAVNNNSIAALRDIAVDQVQNRPTAGTIPYAIDTLVSQLQKFHIGAARVTIEPNSDENTRGQVNPRRFRAPSSTNAFQKLETVPEDDQPALADSEAAAVSDRDHQILELPTDEYKDHPLNRAADNVASAEEQISKHRAGQFEWILAIPLFAGPDSKRTYPTEDPERLTYSKKIFFGCTVIPRTLSDGVEWGATSTSTITLLATPLQGDEEPLEDKAKIDEEPDMAAVQIMRSPHALADGSAASINEHHLTPASNGTPNKNDLGTATKRSPSKSPPRIEDSVEALDQLEDQLEAFDEAAFFRKIVSPATRQSPKDTHRITPKQTLEVQEHVAQRAGAALGRTPSKSGSATVRVKPTDPARKPSVRRSTSMIFLDSPKIKSEDKPLVQAPPKKPAPPRLTSLAPPKPLAKSTKAPTVSTFELPGEAVARRLKEKKEARLSMNLAAEKTASAAATPTIRRAKSVKVPTIPKFELPGEAISRRKREEHEAKLRAQEEEERRRREFKARPIRNSSAPSALPRETVASRARQSKVGLAENSHHDIPTLNGPTSKRHSIAHTPAREPLSTNINRSQSQRGRNLTVNTSVASEASRATSSSTGSVSGKRSTLSAEDAAYQRLRGQKIYQRDNSFVGDREREKKDREALARLAREEAAERSRAASREWAEKQRRKKLSLPVGPTL